MNTHISPTGFLRHLDAQAQGKAYEGFGYQMRLHGIPFIMVCADQVQADALVSSLTQGRANPDPSKGLQLLVFKKAK